MTTPAYRLLGSGRRRRLGDGRVRSVGAPISRFTDIAGSTGFGVGASAGQTVTVPAVGQTGLVFDMLAEMDALGFAGSASLSIGADGVLGGRVPIEGATAIGVNLAARLTYAGILSASLGLALSATGTLSRGAPLAGSTGADITVAGYLTPPAYLSGQVGIGFTVNGRISGAAALRWGKLWADWYEARAEGWAAVDANNRLLAKNAAGLAEATADALVLTETKVEDLEDGVQAVASRTTALETRATNLETASSSQASAISVLQTTTTTQGSTISSHSMQLTNVQATLTSLDGTVTSIANAQVSLSAEVSSLGVLKSAYTVYLNSNGKIAGFRSINDGITASFEIMADVFRVLGGTTKGMEWQGNYIRVYDTGYQLVIGTGFGASNDLVFWFGPNIGAAACTTNNCVEAKTTTGQTFIRGSSASGTVVITNSLVSVYDENNQLRVRMGLW